MTSFPADGSTLEGEQQGATIDGFVRSASGELYRFHHNDMTRRLGYGREGGQPDSYTLIATRQGTEMVGRGGAVRTGKPSENIIALDLPASAEPTPGVYYGRVAGTTDKVAFDINDTPDGRTLRAYVSDGVSGTITLPGAPARRFFAAPAGDGAGIYDVKVLDDRTHMGTSAEGGKLELKYDDGMVMGTVTSPTRVTVDLLGADLTKSYEYGVDGSMPGTYVAFAAPRGRFLIGRSGDVRAGHPGLNIIGLDKKC